MTDKVPLEALILRASRMAVRDAFATEAWMAPDDGYQAPKAEHPLRTEVVSLNADDGCECLIATRDIIRPRRSNAYLAKLIERTRQPRGRLMDLLNDDIRPTSELSDAARSPAALQAAQRSKEIAL